MPNPNSSRPLAGLRVALTRARSGSDPEDPLAALLKARRALPVHHPLTRIVPPADLEELERAGRRILDYDWILVTSPRAVPPLLAAIAAGGRSITEVRDRGTRVCAVGPRTADALSVAGLAPDLIPERFLAEGVVHALRSTVDPRGLRMLFPRALEARDVIPKRLEAQGAHVDVVPAYRSMERQEEALHLAGRVAEGRLDAVVFTAGSGARAFGRGWREYCTSRGREREDILSPPPRVGLLAIGPATAASLAAQGLPVHGTADPHTFEGLVDALGTWAETRNRGEVGERL